MGRSVRRACPALVVLGATASIAQAQGTLAGVVRDATGAVLPGVAVEAASPALIEKVRTTVTDNSGQYRIVDLRGGVYTVTFTLTGFTTVKRAGVQLAGEAITAVNIDMRLGELTETITVSGEAATMRASGSFCPASIRPRAMLAAPAATRCRSSRSTAADREISGSCRTA